MDIFTQQMKALMKYFRSQKHFPGRLNISDATYHFKWYIFPEENSLPFFAVQFIDDQ